MQTKRTNLPLQLTSFIGRGRQLVDLHHLIAGARLLTLIGAGGVGKTRLALRLAEDLVETMPDGVWLVEFAALQDAQLVSQVVVTTLDVRRRDAEPLHVILEQQLRDRELLLVFDNCEHVAAACAALVSDLLRACPRLRILATSREPLNVVGETTWRVPSLSVPDASATSGADEIAASEAVRLFVERSRLVFPGFLLTDRSAASVAHICRDLDGIPLAIELAAARVSTVGVEQILARLDDRFRLLKTEGVGVPARHRTLRATVEWSHDLLFPEERVLLRRLSVFNGGWSLEAAEAVCSGDGLESGQILELLAKLVNRSLVMVEGQEAAARYGLLETLRQFAYEKLGEAGEITAVRHRHLSWCVELAEEAASKLSAPGQQTWLDALEREHDNVRAALAWSLQCGRIDLCLRLAVACGYFWEIRGHRYRSEGLRWLLQANSHPTAETAPTILRARALYWAGTYASELYQFQQAAVLLEESLSIWQELGDTRGMAEALLSLGYAARVRGEYQRAAMALDQALHLMQERADELGTAEVQLELSALSRLTGNLDEAEAQAGAALRIFHGLGELHQVGHVEIGLGELAREKGAFQRAAELYAHGAALLGQAGCEEGVNASRYFLARLARDESSTHTAYTSAVDALRAMRDAGLHGDVPRYLELLAEIAVSTDPRRATGLLAAADSLRTARSTPVHLLERGAHEQTLAAARSRLSRAAFAEAWNAGARMRLDEAISYALAGSTEPTPRAAAGVSADVTARESEVATLIGQGRSNREIAEALVISERTAEAHVTHIFNKLGLRSRAQLAVWAVEHSLLASVKPAAGPARPRRGLNSGGGS